MLIYGDATFYAPGVMTEVLANRIAWGHVQPCPECIGMVALADCGQLGARAWIIGPRGMEGQFLVTDCGTFLTPGRVAEVDWDTAQRWGMRGPVEVIVLIPEADDDGY